MSERGHHTLVARVIEACADNRLLVLLSVAFASAVAVYSIRRVELDAIPDLSDPQVIIFTEWMGRSPTLVEDQVTYPIVSSLVAAPSVADVRGFSMFGMSFVYVVFEEGTDLYWARSRVLEYLAGIRARLPAGVDPVLGPDATGIGWIFQYVLVDRSGRHGLEELRAFQDYTLRYALGSVPGVAEVASAGGFERQYQVTIDPTRLRSYGVTLSEVVAAIRDSSNDVGGRVLEMSGREYYVRGRGYIERLEDLEQVAVRAVGPGGTPILVRDVARVRFGPELRRGLLEWNGEGEVAGGIVVLRHGENALAVIERVKQKLEDLRPSLPEGVEIEVAYDRSALIGRSIETLRDALVEEAIAVSLVIILFLLHVRSSLLPILSLPVSVALAFIPMYLLDIPSTIMSLGGIAIAMGATVDAEIVMIEAAHKKLEHAGPGADRRKLLAEAAREVTPAIFFSLLIIAVSFLPVFTLTGQAGRMFKPLAYTKTFVMLFSALLSITFAPALRDFLIRGRIFSEDRHPISRMIIRLYKPFVYVALRSPRSTVAIGLLAVISALPIAARLGQEFMPPLDEGDVLYMPITFPNIAIEEAKVQLQRQDRVLRGFPEVRTVLGKVGRAESPTDPAPITMVETTIQLRPRSEWRRVAQERWYSGWAPAPIAAVLRPLWPETRPMTMEELTSEMNDAMQFPGWTNAFTMPIKARIDMLATGIRTPVGVKVLGPELARIEELGIALERAIAAVPGTRSVLYERNLGGLYVDIVPDRERLARHGVTVGEVERIIEAAIGGAPVAETVEGRGRFSINVRYLEEFRSDLDQLRRVLVPIGASRGAGPVQPGMSGMGSELLREAPGARDGVRLPPLDALAPELAQLMPEMGPAGGGGGAGSARPRSEVPPGGTATDGMGNMGGGMGTARAAREGAPGGGGASPEGQAGASGPGYLPLGQLADIRIVEGPPMVRDENGLLAGYVYVDLDQGVRDIGGFVTEAKAAVAQAQLRGELVMPPGYFLEWTGQWELLEDLMARLELVIPLTVMIVILLLYLHFGSLMETLIVLLSIPFALVGSTWLLWLLDYQLSTAVWVGVIALVGLATQTGIVMIVYIDNAYLRRKRAGMIRDLDDIIWAHMEGTVMRVRPKLMTVATMLMGLVPLLWASGSGADVMKRIAAPMVGGLITSAFLTLEIIPVVYTYWRQEELLLERLSALEPRSALRLGHAAHVVGAGLAVAAGVLLLSLYVDLTQVALMLGVGAGVLVAAAGAAGYLVHRPVAYRRVWPHRVAGAPGGGP